MRSDICEVSPAHSCDGVGVSPRACAIKVKGGPDAKLWLSDGTSLRAGHMVIATNTPFNDRVRMHTKQHAYRTYVVGFDIPRDVYPAFLLWNLDDPYYYVRRVRIGQRHLIIVGGADHKVGQENDAPLRYRAIEHWSRSHLPALGEVTHRWSGQVMEPVDGLAYIGRNPMDDENVYIITGDSGHGLTHGTLGGALIRDLVLGHENPYTVLYDPSRKTLRTAGTYLGENANVTNSTSGPVRARTVSTTRRPGGCATAAAPPRTSSPAAPRAPPAQSLHATTSAREC